MRVLIISSLSTFIIISSISILWAGDQGLFGVTPIVGLELRDQPTTIVGVLVSFRMGSYVKPYFEFAYNQNFFSELGKGITIGGGAHFILPSKEWTVRPHAMAELTATFSVGDSGWTYDESWSCTSLLSGGGVHIKLHPKLCQIAEGGFCFHILGGEPCFSGFTRLGMELILF